MNWRIRESAYGWYAEKGAEVIEHACSWKPGFVMEAFVVVEAVRFETRKQAEKYIKNNGGM